MRRDVMTRRGWITCALAIVGAGWTFVLAAQPVTESLLEVRVRGVTVDPQAGSPVVLLEDLQGDRVLPIWVGVFEARAIAMEMDQVAPPRPMTHDLIKNIIEGMKAQVTNVVIIDLKDNTFYAQIALHTGAASLQIDARPSDRTARRRTDRDDGAETPWLDAAKSHGLAGAAFSAADARRGIGLRCRS